MVYVAVKEYFYRANPTCDVIKTNVNKIKFSPKMANVLPTCPSAFNENKYVKKKQDETLVKEFFKVLKVTSNTKINVYIAISFQRKRQDHSPRKANSACTNSLV